MDLYKIGISIVAQNGVSAILAVIQKDVLKLHKTVGMTEAGLKRMRLAAVGALAVGVGGSMIAGILNLSKAGEKYTAQLEQMKVAGMGVAEIQKSIVAANRVSSTVMTTDPTHNLQTIRELRGALMSADVEVGRTPNTADATNIAIAHLAQFQKATAVMSASLGKDAGGQVYEMAKALEMIGASQDPARFDKLLDGMVRSSVAFGGKLTGRDYYQTFKYLRGAAPYLDDDFIMNYLPSLMQEMKTGAGSGSGGGAGNPLASAFQEIVGNVYSQTAARVGVQLGLIDPKKLHYTKGGKIKSKDVGSWYDATLYAHNPFEYVLKDLKPALQRAHLLDVGSDGKIKDIGRLASTLASLFGNRTAQQIMGMMVNQQGRLVGDSALIKSSMHVDDAYKELSRHNPQTVRDERDKQWERLRTDIGKAITPAVTEATYQFANALRQVAEIIERHPTATKYIVGIVAGVATLLIALGSFAAMTALLGALGVTLGGASAAAAAVTAIVAAIAGAIYVLNRIGWDRVVAALRSGWDHLKAWILSAVGSVGGWAFAMYNAIIGFVGRVGHAVSGYATAAVAWIASMVGALRDWVTGVSQGMAQVLAASKSWVSQIVTSLQSDLLAIWTGMTEGLVGLVKRLGAWFAALPQMLWSAITGGHAAMPTGAPGAAQAPATPAASPAAPGPRALPGPAVIQRQSYMPPQSNHQPIRVENVMYLDGKVVYRNMVDRMGRAIGRPLQGATGFDGSAAPALHGPLAMAT